MNVITGDIDTDLIYMLLYNKLVRQNLSHYPEIMGKVNNLSSVSSSPPTLLADIIQARINITS